MLRSISYFFITGFYSGLAPKAPGTAGTLSCALLVFILWNFLPNADQFIAVLSPSLLCLFSTILGLICTDLYYRPCSNSLGNKFDPQEVVVDEFAGFLLTLSFLPPNNTSIIIAFILFRIFDISKPWPVKVFEKLPGAWGVMMDDIVAGLYGGLVILVFKNYISW